MDFYRFKTEKYRKATRHLDTFQHGCYRLLIDEYMDTREPLPDNDQALANICHCTLQEFLDHASTIIRSFFIGKDGLLFHDYCDEELNYQDSKRRFASEKAQKAAKARYIKNKDLHATSMHQECLAMPELRVKSKERKKEIEGKKFKNKKSIGVNCPSDWKPSYASSEKAKVNFIDLIEESEKFKNWHGSKGNKFVNWDMAFNNWLTKAIEYKNKNNPHKKRNAMVV